MKEIQLNKFVKVWQRKGRKSTQVSKSEKLLDKAVDSPAVEGGVVRDLADGRL